jgi:TolA-binding protein
MTRAVALMRVVVAAATLAVLAALAGAVVPAPAAAAALAQAQAQEKAPAPTPEKTPVPKSGPAPVQGPTLQGSQTIRAIRGAEKGDVEADERDGEELTPQQSYDRILEMLLYHTPQDTMGTAAFAAGLRSCEAGRYDEGVGQLRAFTQQYPRNLFVNEALETILLVRANREFKDEPLRLYLAAQLARRTGRPDTAAVLAREAMARFPGARLRDRWSYMLAELSRDRGDHAAAIGYALAVADTSAKSRLAPYALRLAAEETLAIGAEPQRALRYYQDLLERFPDSPLAPEARTRALELRKKLQL